MQLDQEEEEEKRKWKREGVSENEWMNENNE